MKPLLLLICLSCVLSIACKESNDYTEGNENIIIGNIKPTASIGDTLTVSAENLPTNTGSLSVLFGTEKANIISQQPTSVKFVVPVLKTNACEIYLKDGSNILKQQSFNLESVKITSVKRAKSGEALTVYGKNFQFLSNIKVSVNNKDIIPTNVSSSGLTFTFPDTIYPGRTSNITIKDNSLTSTLTANATVSDKWVRVAYSPFVFRSLFEAFVFKNEGYVLSYNKEGSDKKAFFYKLNPDTYKYTTYEVPIATTGAVATPNNIYCIQNKAQIFKYNLATGSSQYITQVPVTDYKIGHYFTIGEDIYAFIGILTNSYYTDDFKLYKYSVSTNTWTKLTDLPEQASGHLKITVIGAKAYIVKEYKKFYIYNSETNSWESKPFPINPSNYNLTAYYSHQDKLYALISPSNGLETVYEYTPQTQSWKNLGILRKEGSSNFYGFFIGNKHFIGGSKHDSFSSQLFESDESYIYEDI